MFLHCNLQISGLYRDTSNSVGNPGVNILVAVGRAARMGRFIRTTVVVEYAARLNLNQYLNPNNWCKNVRSSSLQMNQNENVRVPRVSTSTRSLNGIGASIHGPDYNEPTDNDETEPRKRRYFHDIASAVGISKKASEEHIIKRQNTDEMRKKQRRMRDSNSHVGSAMRELTGQRVAIGVMLAMILNILFTYTESDGTQVMTMILLHGQTSNGKFANKALNIAKSSVVPMLFSYKRYNESDVLIYENWTLDSGRTLEDIRVREMLNITIHSNIADTNGWFDNRYVVKGGAMTVSYHDFKVYFWLSLITNHSLMAFIW